MRFGDIEARNWKNFKNVRARLGQRVFVLGPNASGKSNFLDIFRFFQDIVSPGGGFIEAVRRRGGVSAIRCLAATRYSQIDLTVGLYEGEERRWTYSLSFSAAKAASRGDGVIVSERITNASGDTLAERPDIEDERDPERLSQTALEQLTANKEFRAVADFFRSLEYLHIVPQLVRESRKGGERGHDPYGRDFLERIAATPKRTRESRLRRILKALRQVVPQIDELQSATDPDTGIPHLRAKYAHWRPQGHWQEENQFSDGTLRLIGLLWALLESTGPLLLEEPELSLNDAIVRQLPALFSRVQRKSNSQIMLSTHSEAILRSEDVGLDEVLLVQPSPDGSDLVAADSLDDVRDVMSATEDLAVSIRPHTVPKEVLQLSFIDALL